MRRRGRLPRSRRRSRSWWLGSVSAWSMCLRAGLVHLAEHLGRDIKDVANIVNRPSDFRGPIPSMGQPIAQWHYSLVFANRPAGLRIRCNPSVEDVFLQSNLLASLTLDFPESRKERRLDLVAGKVLKRDTQE